MTSVIAALAAGNTLVAVIENKKQKQIADLFVDAVNRTGITDHVFSTTPLSYLNQVLMDENISGAIVDWKSDWQGYLSQKIAERIGEILPVICEPNKQTLFYRLVTEKTVSIDTTAAGGNASLMTMAEDGMLDL
jgi:RHH-type transcriptional regulator, proline utilization regulon repressor / proline dehydrogenase / delta 1-pyrroline-5-carboxylate dehydrogenase